MLGCSLSRSGYGVSRALDGGAERTDATSVVDGPPDRASDASAELDAGEPDADPMGRDAAAGPVDAGAVDAGRPDAGRPDAGPADAGRDAGSSERARCETTYGERMGRQICEERETECEVYVRHMPMNGTCDDACEAGGGECLRAYEEASDSARCDRAAEHGCDAVRRDHVCVCTRP